MDTSIIIYLLSFRQVLAELGADIPAQDDGSPKPADTADGTPGGIPVGMTVGTSSGTTGGTPVGTTVGMLVRTTVGTTVGTPVDMTVGMLVGTTVGPTVGTPVDMTVGPTVGMTFEEWERKIQHAEEEDAAKKLVSRDLILHKNANEALVQQELRALADKVWEEKWEENNALQEARKLRCIKQPSYEHSFICFIRFVYRCHTLYTFCD
jgi:hypothetical protein